MNFSKTTVRDLDDLKIRIIQKIEAIRKETPHNVFMGAKRLNFCILIQGICFK
jgi:hypothetical protein